MRSVMLHKFRPLKNGRQKCQPEDLEFNDFSVRQSLISWRPHCAVRAFRQERPLQLTPQKSSRTCVAASFHAPSSLLSFSRSSCQSFSAAMRSTTSTIMASVKPATTYVMDSLVWFAKRIAFFGTFYAQANHSSAEGEFSEAWRRGLSALAVGASRSVRT